MNSRHAPHCSAMAVLLICCTCAHGDTVYLKNGGKLEGTVKELDDRLVVTHRFGKVTVSKKDVLRVHKKKTVEEEYRERDAKLKGDDAGAKLLEQGYDAVFVAAGLWKSYQLEMPGVELKGVSHALKFLERARHKQKKARKLVEGKNVAIIGGGSVAMDVARCARELGAERIYAIALEGPMDLPAQTVELAEAQADGVIIMPFCQATEILGEDGRVSGIKGTEIEWILPGNFRPDNARTADGTSWQLKVGAVIQAIGQGPTGSVRGLVASASKDGWMLQVDDVTQATSLDKVYAGGDLARGASTVVAAVGDGKRAAAAIHDLLSKEVV